MYFGTKDNSVEATAAAWVVRLDSGELTDSEQRELGAWIAEDPRHAGALIRAQTIWADADRVAALDVGRMAGARGEDRAARQRRLSPPIRRWLAAVFAVAVVASALRVFRHTGETRKR